MTTPNWQILVATLCVGVPVTYTILAKQARTASSLSQSFAETLVRNRTLGEIKAIVPNGNRDIPYRLAIGRSLQRLADAGILNCQGTVMALDCEAAANAAGVSSDGEKIEIPVGVMAVNGVRRVVPVDDSVAVAELELTFSPSSVYRLHRRAIDLIVDLTDASPIASWRSGNANGSGVFAIFRRSGDVWWFDRITARDELPFTNPETTRS